METVTRSDVVLATYDTTSIRNKLMYRNKANGKELLAFMIEHTARREIPYGIWTCEDGSEVIFNREYQPIYCRKDGVNTYDDRSRWVKNITNVKYLFNDLTTPLHFLTKHVRGNNLSVKQINDCKKSLYICMDIIKKYSPEENESANRSYSIADL